MKTLLIVVAIIVGYLVGYFITVAAITLVSLFNNGPLSRLDEDDISEVSLAWPILLPLIIVGARLAVDSGKKMVCRIKEHFENTERGSK